MSYRYPDFAGDALQLWNKNVWNATRAADWATFLTALASDTRTHDKTIQNPAIAISVQGPGAQTRIGCQMALLINRGLGGNLDQSQMIAAFGAASGTAEPPGNIDRPFVTSAATPPIVGTVLSSTTGNWAGTPTSYTYQWTRDSVNIASATSATYTLVSADVGGHDLRCVVSAVNATGTSQGSLSNKIKVP